MIATTTKLVMPPQFCSTAAAYPQGKQIWNYDICNIPLGYSLWILHRANF